MIARPLATFVAVAVVLVAAPAAGAGSGRNLFREGCANCHGDNGGGVHGRGPSLHGVGVASADFYLSTGRMPIEVSHAEPERARPQYSRAEIAALDRYVGSLGAGPRIPHPDSSNGGIAQGMRLFADTCAGCHQIVARGGVVTGGYAPNLQSATTRQIYEAVRVGPYFMPAFDRRQISDGELASIAKYVRSTRKPDDRGGWGIGNVGPVPEGIVTFLLGIAALLGVTRLVGARNR